MKLNAHKRNFCLISLDRIRYLDLLTLPTAFVTNPFGTGSRINRILLTSNVTKILQVIILSILYLFHMFLGLNG